MKNLKIKVIAFSIFSFSLIVGCSEVSKTPVAQNQSTNDLTRFEITELIPRNEGLSKDEFDQIQTKFNNLKAKYTADNSDYSTLLKLAEIYIYEARVSGEHPYYYTAALSTLGTLLNNKEKLNDDQRFTTLFYKSTVELSQHHFSDALETATAAKEINDLNAGIYGVLVDANVEIGNYDEAVKMCDKMMEIRPDLRSYSRSSYLREIYGDLPGSKVAMVNAINAGAPYSEYKCWTLTTLGNIYESEGELDSAQICYEFSTQERENYPFGIAGMARMMTKKGELEKAEKLYTRAIEILPEIGFNIELAKLKKAQGKRAEVANMVEEIEGMFTEDIESGHNMALEYANFLCVFKKDYETAISYGLEELKQRPNNIDVNKLLAFAYYKTGAKKEAKKHLNTALNTEKMDADLWCLKGLLNEDPSIVKKSFIHNPYQNHMLVDEGMAAIQ